MRIITLIASSIIILLGVTFAFLNADIVQLNYYLGSSELPLSVLLVVVLLTGTSLGMILGFVPVVRLKFANRRLRKHLEMIEKEISQIKVLSSTKEK